MKYIEGDLISLAKNGDFDVIGHGCNCMSVMRAGIAVQMARHFDCDKFPLELKGPNINKLGQIDWIVLTMCKGTNEFDFSDFDVAIVNMYTQYQPSATTRPLDYEALTLCLRKMNIVFKGKCIGLPRIGSGLAGGEWTRIEKIIETELKDCDVTVVNFKQ